MRLACLAPIALAVIGLGVFSEAAFAQSLTGKITDESDSPMPGATVSVRALQRKTVSDETGSFRLNNVPHGSYTVEFAFIGHLTETRVVHVEPEGGLIDVVLRASPLEVGAVIVTGTPQPTSILESPMPSSSIGGRQLERERRQTIAATVENMPGVAVFSTGSGIAKPVIRGLTSQRVLVVSDGVRQEGQQWGDGHGPEIDALNLERIEVIRGPASVLYGSDAMGGVVNAITKEPPVASEGAPNLGGMIAANGFSNNSQAAGSVSLEGARGIVGYRGGLSARKSDNIRTPNGELFNSGEKELNGSGALGIHSGGAIATVDYAHFGTELQIHGDQAEEEGATPFQKVTHDRAHVHGLLPLAQVRLEANVGWQRNNRREYEEEAATEPALDLVLHTATAEIKAHHHAFERVNGTAGVMLMHQSNESLAEEKLIPNFDLTDIAGYLYEELRYRQVTFSAGVRADTRTLDVDAGEDLGVEAQKRDYSAATATAGVVWRAYPGLALVAGAGRAWRAPTPFELFADGVHEGAVRYEVGDADLEPEVGFNLELGVRVLTPSLQAEATVFRNKIDRFIYLAPTGDVDPESGFSIYENRQADATLIGTEISAQAQAAEWLILRGGFDFVRGTNNETDNPLPLIPAPRVKLGARITHRQFGALKAPYASVDLKIWTDQNRIEEFETKTDGYTLVDIGVGFEVPVQSGNLTVDVGVENLLDESYRDHLSRYKEYALNAGRNVTLKVAVPFVLAR